MAKITKLKSKKYSLLRINVDTNKKLKALSKKHGQYVIEIVSYLVNVEYDLAFDNQG